jgi:hypothetical protein
MPIQIFHIVIFRTSRAKTQNLGEAVVSGRKVELVTVPKSWGGRDAGRTYRVTEMSCRDSERWAIRALLILTGSGERIPEHLVDRGMEAMAMFVVNGALLSDRRVTIEEISPLLDEMMTCVEVVRDPARPDVAQPLVTDDDVREVRTRLWLRSEVLRVHTGFSAADGLSSLISATRRVDPA